MSLIEIPGRSNNAFVRGIERAMVRRFAEHVEGEAISLFSQRSRLRERLFDRPAKHEVAAQETNRAYDGLPDHRLAQSLDKPAPDEIEIRAFEIRRADDLTCQHQGPGRGVDQQRLRMAEVAGPILPGDLVADEPILSLGVGDAQERLGQAHQHHALVAGKRVLLRERIHALPIFAPRP